MSCRRGSGDHTIGSGSVAQPNRTSSGGRHLQRVGIIRGGSGAGPWVQVWTDASGQYSCGAVVPDAGAWLQLQWPQTYGAGHLVLKEESITLKELLSVVLACAVWGESWRGRMVHVHCDNLGVVALVKLGLQQSATDNAPAEVIIFHPGPVPGGPEGDACARSGEPASRCHLPR